MTTISDNDTDTGNGRITLAVLGNDVKHIIALLEDEKRDGADREARLRELEKIRIPAIEARVTRTEERQGTMAGLQAAFTAMSAMLAGWWGSRP